MKFSYSSSPLALFVLAAVAGAACSAESATEPPAAHTGAAKDSGSEPDDSGDDPTTEETDAGVTTKDAGKPKDGGKADAKQDVNVDPPDTGCTEETWYADTDGDGYGDPGATLSECTKPSGYVADHTDCDDSTAKVHPGFAELCDAVDQDCDGNVNGNASQAAACTAAAGTYTGSFVFDTTEKVGSSVVNEMKCTGTTSVTIALAASDVVKGTVTCNYPGGLSAFNHSQTGTLLATITPSGAIVGTYEQHFTSFDSHTYPITGQLTGSTMNLSIQSSWYPNSMSAVPWGVTATLSATK